MACLLGISAYFLSKMVRRASINGKEAQIHNEKTLTVTTSSAIRILRKLPKRNRITLKNRVRNQLTPNGAKSSGSGRQEMNEKNENGYKMVTLNEKGVNRSWLTP